MDPSYFGLNDHPFTKPSAPDSNCLADEHLALTTELHAGLKAPHGITLLIGDEGAGKTTFIRNFVGQLPDSFVVAYLPTAGPGLRHLLTEAVEQLGGTVVPGGGEQALIDVLRSLARARAEHDRSTLVVIDDAHDLPAKTIERLGKLFGTDPAEPSRLHVTLVGRPELLDRMNAANDRSILKHLVQVCRMDAIGPEDAFRYIADRVQKVGGIVDRLFTEDALRLIVQRANGNPARIDAICSAALERAAGRGAQSVDTAAVDTACADDTTSASAERNSVSSDPPETPTYFFNEDTEDTVTEPAAAPPAVEHPPASTMNSAPRVQLPAAAAGASRRRLAFWAAGAIAVVAAFAGMMTLPGRSPDNVDTAIVDGNAAAKAERRVEKKTAGDEAATGIEQPTAVPKLVMRKDGEGGHQRLGARRNGEDRQGDVAAAQATAQPPSGGAAAGEPAAPVPASPGMAATGDAAAPATGPVADRPRFPAPPLGAIAPSAVADAPAEAAKPPTPAVAALPTTPPAAAVPTAQPPQQVAQAAVPTAPAPAAASSLPAPPVAAPVHVEPVTPLAPVAVPASAATAAPSATAPRAKPADAGLVAPTRAPVPAATAKPAPAAVAPTTTASAGGGAYTVQLGAFSSRANAEALVAKVRGSAPEARIVASTAGGKPVFRVVAGSFASSSEAATRSRTLAKSGLSTFVRRGD